jgi:hypothetical protein
MKLSARVFLCSVCLCLLAPAAHAQTTTGSADVWSFNVGLNGSYEGNALFVGPEENEEFSHAVQANLSRNFTLRRGSANLVLSGNQYFYRESTSLNDFRYNVGGGLSHALTRRLQWAGNTNLSSGLARDSEVLTEAGLVLPSVSTRTSSSSSMFSYALSRRSQISWTVSQAGVGFSSGLFQGGSTLSSMVSWSRQVGRSQTLGISQDYGRTFTDAASTSVHGVFGTWSGTVGTWTAHANVGVRPFSVPEEDGLRFTLGMSAGLTKPVRPGQSMGITYDRTISPTFGIDTGNHLLQAVTGNYTIALTRNVSTAFGGSYSRGSNPVTPDRRVEGQTGTASLTYRMTQQLGLMFATSLYSRKVPDAERATSYNMMTSLTYGFTWR